MFFRLLPRANGLQSQIAIVCRNATTSAVPTAARPRDKIVEDWESFKMPLAPYEGMGPLPPRPVWDPKSMRHYVFPEYWFEFLYPRLGVTGPYTLGFGTLAFLFSKEWYVYTPETWNTIALIIVAGNILKVVGPTVNTRVQMLVENHYDAIYRLKMNDIDAIEAEIDDVKTEKWRSGLQELYHEVKKSNLALMLETEYLDRKSTLASAVKRRLDYQIAIQQADRDIAHSHMVQWIQDKVKMNITPESQKATLNVCISRLNAMTADDQKLKSGIELD